MKTFLTRSIQIGGIVSLLASQWLYAQHPGAALPGKTIKRDVPVSTESLQARVVKGGRPSSANGRMVNHPVVSSFPTIGQLTANTDHPAELVIKKSAQTDLPIFIQGTVSNTELSSPNGRTDILKASLNYLRGVQGHLQVKDPAYEFYISETSKDDLAQSHIRMKQVYQGVEVYGGEIILHARENKINGLNGRYFPTPSLKDITPEVPESQALQAAINDLSQKTNYHVLSASQKQLLQYEQPEAQLVIYHLNNDPHTEHLTWHISIRPNFQELWEYFVDANTGKVLNQYNHTCSFADGARTTTSKDLNGANQTINSYQLGNAYYLVDASRTMFDKAKTKFPDSPVGVIMTFDANNTSTKNFKAQDITSSNNTWNDKSAVSAHTNAGKAYEYFRTVHNRNSIDGAGGNIISFVNLADEDGKGLDNASWNGKFMFYGNGRIACKPLAGGLDVAGHEMSHGVIGSTAKLEYQGQSGAMNESFADIFGAMIDSDDWTMGEDIVLKSFYPSGAMRSFIDPHNGGKSLTDEGYQPKHMSELYTGAGDNGGVHINSGIINFAYYKIATTITKQKAEKIYYRALTNYLTAKSQFVDLRLAVIQAATDIHGANSAEVAAAKKAFDEVGIYETGGKNEGPKDLPTNTGQDFILCHDAGKNESNSNTIFVVAPTGTDLKPRSKTISKNRPSITDKGDFAYFVGKDSRIKAVSLSGTAQESVVQNQPIWEQVAISKDGKHLAAITTDADTSIYVYDFDKQKWTRFMLYNPTYSGIETGGVLFADAIEWDYTGENLIYDAYNVIEKQGGANNAAKNLDYWDVGIIKVWDNKKNDFGDGTIRKLFPDLPEGVSIGNPSFSKNSPDIIAFDFMDGEEETYAIIGVDLLKSKAAVIAENNTLGFPTYSKTDDKVAYTAVSAKGDTVINVISLKADKITGTGKPTTLLNKVKWATWFTQGERKVLSAAKDITYFEFAGMNPKAVGEIKGNAITVVVPQTVELKNLIAVFTHSPDASVKVGNTAQTSGATKNDFSNPVTYTVTAQDGTTRTYTVTATKSTSTGVDDYNDISGTVSLYPNPTNGPLKVKLEEITNSRVTLEVFSSAGKLVYEQTSRPDAGELQVQLPPVATGIYYLRLTMDDKVAYKKVLVTR